MVASTRQFPSVVRRMVGRLRQGFGFLAPRDMSAIDAELHRLLAEPEYRLVARLVSADRAHLLSVHQQLVQADCRDADLLKAALLHDVGKADGDLRVGLLTRTIAVLLNATAPGLLTQLASLDGAAWRRTFALAESHPALGARLARDAGCNERVCWLIEHHQDAASSADAALQLLQAADEGRIG